MVFQMVKGIFKIHFKLPKYVVIYDPDIVLQYVMSLLMCCRCFFSTKIFVYQFTSSVANGVKTLEDSR